MKPQMRLFLAVCLASFVIIPTFVFAAGSTTTSTTTSSTALAGLPELAGLTDAQLKAQGLYVIENAILQYVYDHVHSRIIVYDKRAGKQWWAPSTIWNISVTPVKFSKVAMQLALKDKKTNRDWSVRITMDATAAEVLYEVVAPSDYVLPLFPFPPVFEVSADSELILPISEGLKIPVSRYIQDFPKKTYLFGGPWPMQMFGVQEGNASWCEIVETETDFMIVHETKSDGRTVFYNYWQNTKGAFGYKRQIRYCFFDKGGYVAMAKRMRQFAYARGYTVPLYTKNNARNGSIDKLIGAVDLWYFGGSGMKFIQELKSSNINKVLFSNARYLTDSLDTINSMGYLTSRYDNYQDVWPSGVTGFPTEGWPNDLVLDATGAPVKGWTVTQNGKTYTGGIACSYPGATRAKISVSGDVSVNHYKARFLDTVGASPWRECFNPAHPTSKLQDQAKKKEMMYYMSSNLKLVTGTEDGSSVLVPVIDYSEGLMSAGGRLPNSSYNVEKVEYMTPTASFLRYQVGEQYRIPLWELVFHDSVVTTWYWGDSSNRIPEVWWRRDLLNILYGNMPLWAIRDYNHWKQYQAAFIASYKNVSPVFGKVGYKQMISHSFLTTDKTVQDTTFSGNIRIIVNFGSKDYKLSSTVVVKARGFVVLENGVVWKSGVCTYAGLQIL